MRVLGGKCLLGKESVARGPVFIGFWGGWRGGVFLWDGRGNCAGAGGIEKYLTEERSHRRVRARKPLCPG